MSRIKSFFGKLRDKYRLSVVNESSFEEKFAFRLSRWNVIMLGASFTVLLAVLLILAIIYTPLKTMIPGYSNAQEKRNAEYAKNSAVELESKQDLNQAYLFNLKKVLRGELAADSVEVIINDTISYENLNYAISKEDSTLRAEVAEKEKYNLVESNPRIIDSGRKLSDLNFFCPLRGELSSKFQVGVDHLGVDIVAPANETIKSILDGVVILSTWSYEEGYVIAVQHPDQVISIYKHNSVLLKNIGEMVEVGESIAVIGNSGELTDGPHLHFELWHQGVALDPTDYIIFD